MRKILFMIFIVYQISCILNCVFAQAPSIQWTKCYGGSGQDHATSIQETSDGGYIFVGWSSSNDSDVSDNNGNYDYWIVKTDNTGNILWQKCFGGSDTEGSDNYNSFPCIQRTSDGGYVIVGSSTSNDSDLSVNHGSYDYWLLKIDSIGNILWQKSYGGSAADQGYFVQQTHDGGYIVIGTTNSNDGDVNGNHGSYDYWVIKTDSSGNFGWRKCYGGSGDDVASSAQQTSDGGFIFAGWSNSNDSDVSGNHGGYDYWVVKSDSAGSIVWQKCYGGSSNDIARCIVSTNDGGYIIAGCTDSNNDDVSGNHGNSDYWLIKVDSIGTLQWQKCYGSSGSDQAFFSQQTNDGGYIISGECFYNDGDVTGNHGYIDFWIVKTNSIGNLQWQKSLGGSDYEGAHSVHQTSDDGYIVAGGTFSNDGDVSGTHGVPGQQTDYWIVKLAPEGIGISEYKHLTCNLTARLSHSNNLALTFYSSQSSNLQLTLTDITGRTLYQTQLRATASSNKKEIFVGDLAKGIYIVTLSGVEGNQSVKVFNE